MASGSKACNLNGCTPEGGGKRRVSAEFAWEMWENYNRQTFTEEEMALLSQWEEIGRQETTNLRASGGVVSELHREQTKSEDEVESLFFSACETAICIKRALLDAWARVEYQGMVAREAVTALKEQQGMAHASVQALAKIVDVVVKHICFRNGQIREVEDSINGGTSRIQQLQNRVQELEGYVGSVVPAMRECLLEFAKHRAGGFDAQHLERILNVPDVLGGCGNNQAPPTV